MARIINVNVNNSKTAERKFPLKRLSYLLLVLVLLSFF